MLVMNTAIISMACLKEKSRNEVKTKALVEDLVVFKKKNKHFTEMSLTDSENLLQKCRPPNF